MSILQQANLFGCAIRVHREDGRSEHLLRRLRTESRPGSPTPEEIDRALIAEVRQEMPLGVLSLQCSPCDAVLSVRRHTLRINLERAVVQLPHTERMIFLMHDVESHDHARIARTLGLTEDESRSGLHQARLRMRELLSK